MNFRKTTLLLIASFFFLQVQLFSQSSATYTFSNTTTGSLIDMSSGTTQLIAGSVDDGVSSVTNIGFEFVFMGTIYSQFSVSSNGLLRLGSTVVSAATTNVIQTTGNTPCITAFWEDLATNSTGKVHFKTIGSSPNRKLVVEWLNMEMNYGSSTANSTFQLILSENSGVIEFYYGSMAIGTGSGTLTASIGFTRSSGSNQFLSVSSISTPAVSTSTATDNLVATNTVGNISGLNSSADGSRVTYKFTPIQTKPSTPSGLNFTAVNMSGMTLNWTDNTVAESGYALYMSTDGTNYTLYNQYAANTTSALINALNPSTTYYWKVYAVREGVVSFALSGSQTTLASAGTITSIANGSWSNTATWSTGTIPTYGDNVTISDNHTVTIDINAYCNNLTIGQTSGSVLEFEQTTARTLMVQGNISIVNGSTFRSNLAGIQTGHFLSANGSITNNGIFDFSTNSNTASASITFTGASNATFSGTGTITDIRTITMNKGTSYASVLELSPTNLTVQGVNTDVATFLTLTNGMFKISGTFTLTNKTLITLTIPSTAGLELNNPNYTIVGRANTLSLNGKLVVNDGTFNIGTSTQDLNIRSGAIFELNGGAVNIAESFYAGSAQSGYTYSQTGGTLTVCTVTNPYSNIGSFHFQSSGTFNMSGGKIIIRNPSSVSTITAAYDYFNTAATRNITGGTIQFGDALTGAKKRFYQNLGYFSNVSIDNSGGADSVFLTKFSTTIEPTILLNTTISNNTILDAGVMNFCNPIFAGNVSINSGGKLIHGTSTINIGGNFTNNGTYTVTTGTANFNGGSNQTVGGSSTSSFYNFTNSNTSTGLTLGSNINVSNTLNMSGATADILLDGNTIDLGTTGSISGESSSDRIYGSTGSITATRTLNNVSSYDVAGTGLFITTAANMGLTVFTRKHNAYSNSQFTSILRNFEISPTTNTGLDATISVNYFDAELNGLASQEANFELWRSTNGGSTWTERAGSANTVSNSISLSQIDAFSTWTVGPAASIVLGDQLISFEASKRKDEVEVNWKIAQEIGIEQYEVESSFDGEHFRGIGIVEAENSSRYQLEDANYVNGINYYRLKMTNTNGEETYSLIRSVDMNKVEAVLIKTVNTLGQEVEEHTQGLVIKIYSDGSVVKINQ
jgi:hypothetical protein